MYLVIKGPYPGTIETKSKYGKQLWSIVNLRKLKNTSCAVCEQPVGERAYKPITNKNNRMRRICLHHKTEDLEEYNTSSEIKY